MKRWAIGSVAFLLTLAFGFAIAELVGPPMPTVGEEIVVSEPLETLGETNSGLEIIDEINAGQSCGSP